MVKNKIISNSFKFFKLKKSQKNEILDKIKFYYGVDCENLENFYFYANEKGKTYISSIDFESLEFDRVNSLGIYFGTMADGERFRLSIEGSKFVEPKQNFIVINEAVLKSYLAAENLFEDEVVEFSDTKDAPFYIVKYSDENIGCVSLKDGIFSNYVSKSRKLDFNKVF